MAEKLLAFLDRETDHLNQAGLLRAEPVMRSPPTEKVLVRNHKVASFASNNYLGLATHVELKRAAKGAIDEVGVGVGGTRPFAGTHAMHTRAERAISTFLRTEDTLLVSSRYHANTGVFEPLLTERDFIFCDSSCNPGLADGVRLSRARVVLYRNNNLAHLEDRLKRSRAARFRAIVTDGVFATDGTIAKLDGLCELAHKYDALVVVDDAHGIGVLGARGHGTPEHHGVLDRVDLVTGTFSHALGGGTGGFVSGRQAIITWLRQKSKPYLVSGALAPADCAAGMRALGLVTEEPALVERLHKNAATVRSGLETLGLDVVPSEHPMIAVRIGDVVTTQKLVDALYRDGSYVLGMCYPVVPEGEARVRIQVSSYHSGVTLKRLLSTFAKAARDLDLIT